MSEKVLVIPKGKADELGLTAAKYSALSDELMRNVLKVLRHRVYEERNKVETDTSVLQLIPYVSVFVGPKKLLAYRRSGSEGRLRDYYSIGFGGHVKECEKACIECAIEREMLEELGLSIYRSRLRLVGLIYDPSTEVSSVHLGLHYTYMLFSTELNQLKPSAEVQDLAAYNFEDLVRLKLENWSELCVNNSETWLNTYDEIYISAEEAKAIIQRAIKYLGT